MDAIAQVFAVQIEFGWSQDEKDVCVSLLCNLNIKLDHIEGV